MTDALQTEMQLPETSGFALSTGNLGDITKHASWNIEPGSVDVLVGGTPCQSFSVAGLRKGLADPRGNLALVYLAIIDQIRPRYTVWENVPGARAVYAGVHGGAGQEPPVPGPWDHPGPWIFLLC